jgi:hypothetical protein
MSKIYRTVDELCSLETLQFIALANTMQELIDKNIEIDEIFLDGMTPKERKDMYTRRAVEFNCTNDYEKFEDVIAIKRAIVPEILKLCDAQKELDFDEINAYYGKADTYMRIFWDDLYIFKRIGQVNEYGPVASNYNSFYMSGFTGKKVADLLASGDMHKATIASISVEDETLMILSAIEFPMGLQEAMIEGYEKEKMIEKRIESYEDYLLEKLTKQ